MAQNSETSGTGNQGMEGNPLSLMEQKALNDLKRFLQADEAVIEDRLLEVNKEWDLERGLQMNAAVLALTGSVLSIFLSRRWLALPILASVILVQQAVQGWSLPVPLFQRFGFRSRKEIEREKYALKVLRGDFKYIRQNLHKVWQAVNQ